MKEANLAQRIYDNLDWAQRVGPDPVFGPGARPVNIWSEVQAVWKATDRTFVEGLYLVLLGRPAEPASLEVWCGALAHGLSYPELVRTLAQSPEARNSHLDVSWLSRLPTPPRRPLSLRLFRAIWLRCKALHPGTLWSKVKTGARRFRAGKKAPL